MVEMSGVSNWWSVELIHTFRKGPTWLRSMLFSLIFPEISQKINIRRRIRHTPPITFKSTFSARTSSLDDAFFMPHKLCKKAFNSISKRFMLNCWNQRNNLNTFLNVNYRLVNKSNRIPSTLQYHQTALDISSFFAI